MMDVGDEMRIREEVVYGGVGVKYEIIVWDALENVEAKDSFRRDICDNQTADNMIDCEWKYEEGSGGIRWWSWAGMR